MGKVLKNITNLKIEERLIHNYDVYYLNFSDLFENAGKIFFIMILAIFSFYKSFILIIFSVPIAFIYPFFIKDKLIKKRKEKIMLEFKDFLRAIQTLLDASYSLENSFLLCANELIMLHGNNSLFVRELRDMNKKIKMNIPIEMVFNSFSNRVKVEEISDFSEMLTIIKRMGGNVNKIIKNTIQVINDKIEIEAEIKTLTAEKQFEQSIMNILPFLIIIYMNFTSSEFLSPLYTTLLGRLLMTLFLIIYIFAIRTSKKILDIEV